MTWWRLGPSTIHGNGVFAARDIAKDEELDSYQIITSDDGGFHGFNHACAHNLSDRSVDSRLRKTLRDIKAGEEITVNYGPLAPLVKNKKCACSDCVPIEKHQNCPGDNMCGCSFCCSLPSADASR